MTDKKEPAWTDLFKRYPDVLVEEIRKYFESTDPFSIVSDSLAASLNCSAQDTENLLKELHKEGYLQTIDHFRCPFCGEELQEEQAGEPECPHCGDEFTPGDRPEIYLEYSRKGQRSRDVRWVLTVHGMNTYGKWQQEFSWLLANLYGYSIPVAIYKYGNIKLSPFFPVRQKHYEKLLLKNIKRLCSEFENPNHKKPDIIAHSFGTWLVAKVLQKNPEIKVGRVILTGSIIRPDFAWEPLLRNKQVDAVLCHHAKKDFPVKISHFFIPDSGPSGYRGFNDRKNVIHIFEKNFGHSHYFKDDHISDVIEEKWTPFLTQPGNTLENFADPDPPNFKPWKPSWLRYITRPLKYLLMIFLLIFLFLLVLAVIFGFKEAMTLCKKVLIWFFQLFGSSSGL